MTTPSSPSLLQVPDRSEWQARCELALSYAKGGMGVTAEIASHPATRALGYQRTLEKVISILEKE